LTTWFARQTPHPPGVAIQPVQGSVQAPCQSANCCPSCMFRAGFPAFGKSAIAGTYGIETARSCQNAESCCLFFLESRRIEPLSHASPQETGSSLGQTASQWSTGRLGRQGLAVLAGSTTAGSLPCFYDSREKFVRFGSVQPGRAQLVRARACRGQNSNFEKKLCQGTFSRPSCGTTPPKLRFLKTTVGTFLG
jgi:hypothetical protein